jgi:hypothetical protein
MPKSQKGSRILAEVHEAASSGLDQQRREVTPAAPHAVFNAPVRKRRHGKAGMGYANAAGFLRHDRSSRLECLPVGLRLS